MDENHISPGVFVASFVWKSACCYHSFAWKNVIRLNYSVGKMLSTIVYSLGKMYFCGGIKMIDYVEKKN
jgi:hypothetical protein